MSETSRGWPLRALTVLAVVAPFNVKVTSDAWTDLQLRILIIFALVIVVGLVVHGQFMRRWERPDLVDGIAYFWFVAVWVSALASTDGVLGVGGAARLSVPILLIPATRSVIRAQGDTLRVLQGLALGSVFGATVGLCLWLWGADLDATKVFVGQVTTVGPFDRLTRPWAHANVAAMALGATLATSATFRARWRAGAALLLMIALVLTISRGGMLAAAAAAIAWVALRRDRNEAYFIGALALVGCGIVLASSAWMTRVDQLGDKAFYAVSIDAPSEFAIDTTEHQVELGITNKSTATWQREGEDRVLISARWIGEDGLIWTEDWWELPRDLAPSESMTAPLSVDARLPIGAYDVRWDLVIPRTAYFGQFLGDPPVLSRASIVASDVSIDEVFRYDLVAREIGLGRIDTWRLAWREFRRSPILGVGPNQFGDTATAQLAAQNRDVGAHAHSIVLEPLATWGLVGTIPFLFLGVGALVRVGRRAWATRALVPAVVTVGLVAVVVHGIVDWPLVVITTGIPVGLLVGLAFAEEEPSVPASAELVLT